MKEAVMHRWQVNINEWRRSFRWNETSFSFLFEMKHCLLWIVGEEFYGNRRGEQVCEQAIQRIPKRLFGMWKAAGRPWDHQYDYQFQAKRNESLCAGVEFEENYRSECNHEGQEGSMQAAAFITSVKVVHIFTGRNSTLNVNSTFPSIDVAVLSH